MQEAGAPGRPFCFKVNPCGNSALIDSFGADMVENALVGGDVH